MLLGLSYEMDADEAVDVVESVPVGYEELFREFMVVSGMPEVVADFAAHKDFNRALGVSLDDILVTAGDARTQISA